MANVERIERRASWTKGGPVVSNMRDEEIVALEEQAAATIGDSTTMGLWGFATGTWIIGTVIAGVFPASALVATAPVLLIFAGIAQFIAGLYAYRRANSLAATAFCSFGSFSVTVAVLYLLQAAGVVSTTGNPIVLEGFLLESFGFIALALCIAALRTNMALVAVLATLTVGYVLAGIPALANSVGTGGWAVIGAIGGWFLVASAFFAYYTGMAMVVNSTWKRTALPIWGEP
jgi:succinate-acetate transporter protein